MERKDEAKGLTSVIPRQDKKDDLSEIMDQLSLSGDSDIKKILENGKNV